MAGGYRSLLAPWIGGVSAPSIPPGFRSLFCFWLGGCYAGATVPSDGIARLDYQLAYERLQLRKKRERIRRDDEELLELLAMFTGNFDC